MNCGAAKAEPYAAANPLSACGRYADLIISSSSGDAQSKETEQEPKW